MKKLGISLLVVAVAAGLIMMALPMFTGHLSGQLESVLTIAAAIVAIIGAVLVWTDKRDEPTGSAPNQYGNEPTP